MSRTGFGRLAALTILLVLILWGTTRPSYAQAPAPLDVNDLAILFPPAVSTGEVNALLNATDVVDGGEGRLHAR